MTQTVSIKDLQTNAPELLSHLAPDHDIIVEDEGKLIARIAAFRAPASSGAPRVPGLFRGKVWMADDFDAPLPDSFWLGES